IRETDMMAGAVEQLRAVWEAEARPHLGRRVAISVRNSPQPIVGTLDLITENGLLLEDADGHKVGISYRRISAIEVVPAWRRPDEDEARGLGEAGVERALGGTAQERRGSVGVRTASRAGAG